MTFRWVAYVIAGFVIGVWIGVTIVNLLGGFGRRDP